MYVKKGVRKKKVQIIYFLMTDLPQDVKRFSSYSICLTGTFPWSNCAIKTLVKT